MPEGSRFASLEDDDILKNVIAAGAARNLHEYLQVKDGQLKNLKRNPPEKDHQVRILNCTVVQYNKTLMDLIFG
jgi:hypothetical protein